MYTLYTGNVLDILKTLSSNSVDMVFTSPPYFALRSYDGDQKVLWGGADNCEHIWHQMTGGLGHQNRNNRRGTQDEVRTSGPLILLGNDIKIPVLICEKCQGVYCALGLETDYQMYIEHLIMIFDEVKRVLKNSGTCWVNLGDSYSSSNKDLNGDGSVGIISLKQSTNRGSYINNLQKTNVDLKPLNLIGIPWRFALAMQDAGWILRSDVIWSKGHSGQKQQKDQLIIACKNIGLPEVTINSLIKQYDIYIGNGMPESVSGPIWKRHKVRRNGAYLECLGCAKCNPHNGYILYHGSWRPTKTHEYVFMFTKSNGYYINDNAAREAGLNTETRNLRTVLAIPTMNNDKEHYATMSNNLADTIVKMGINNTGCCTKCGLPYTQIEHTEQYIPMCNCNTNAVKPMVVLDIFSGTGTTGIAAQHYGATYIGIDINADYNAMAIERFKKEINTVVNKSLTDTDIQMSIFDLDDVL